MKSVQKPNKPQFNYFQVVTMTLPGILGFLFNPIIGVIAICFCLFIAIVNTNNEFDEAMKKYELAQKDFERYQKEELQSRKLKMLEEKTKLKCPQCSSTNIEKISTTSRAVSVAAVGLASGKIGKQYKCKNCKHMW